MPDSIPRADRRGIAAGRARCPCSQTWRRRRPDPGRLVWIQAQPRRSRRPRLRFRRQNCKLRHPRGEFPPLENDNTRLPNVDAACEGLPHTGEASIKECIAALGDRLGLAEDERSELLPSGRQTVFANRVHWARTYLTQARVLEITRRGHFKATQRGLRILDKQPKRVDNELLMQFPEFLQFRALTLSARIDQSAPPTSTRSTTWHLRPRPRKELISLMPRSATKLRAAILDRVIQGTPQFFEKVVVDLLIQHGLRQFPTKCRQEGR